MNTPLETSMLINYVEAIETIIASLDQENSAFVSTSQNGHLWKFKYGSVDVFVQLTGDSEEDTFTVWSPILQLPVAEEQKLLRRLMEMNWLDTLEARFGIFKQQVVVVTSRTVADLSAGELTHLITIVAAIADEHDESLQAEFPTFQA
nr:YbjN domain-containing protein [Petrachloros mirabilis]